MKHSFVVTLDVEATHGETLAYIKDAIQFMGGSHSKNSPFFGLEDAQVTVYRKPSVVNSYQQYKNTLKQLCHSSPKD